MEVPSIAISTDKAYHGNKSIKGGIPLCEISLAALPLGTRGIMRYEQLEAGTGRRLRELGLVEGTEVCHLYSAPSGSPMAFSIRGAVIALRTKDCGRITVAVEAAP